MNLFKNNYFQSDEFKELNEKIFKHKIINLEDGNYFILRDRFNLDKLKFTNKVFGTEFKGILEFFGQPVDLQKKNYRNELILLLKKTTEIIKKFNPGIVIFRSFDILDLNTFDEIKSVFYLNRFKCRPWASRILELNQNLNKHCIFQYNTKREIKIIQSMNPKIEKVTNFEQYKEYFNYFFETSSHQNYPRRSKYLSFLAWENLRKNHNFFFIKIDKIPCAIFAVRIYEDRAYWCMVGIIKKFKYSLHAYAINFLCDYLNSMGIKYFDLAGYNPEPKNQKEKGIKLFKEKFKGKTIYQPTFILDNTLVVKSLRFIVNSFKKNKTFADEQFF
jgi:hypothetical protein